MLIAVKACLCLYSIDKGSRGNVYLPNDGILIVSDFSMANYYYKYTQAEETVFSLPPILRNLNTTSTTIEEEIKKEMNLKYKIFNLMSNLGGFYIVWFVVVGIILRPIYEKMIDFQLVNYYVKNSQITLYFINKYQIKKSKRKVEILN